MQNDFQIMAAFPEIVLALLSMVVLLLGVFGKDDSKNHYDIIVRLAIFSLMTVAYLAYRQADKTNIVFNGMFISDGFSTYMKLLVIGGSITSLLMSTKYLVRHKLDKAEYPALIMFSTIGMMLMISSNSLISLYMGLELQILPLYVLAAMHRDRIRSSEAGLKFFLLGTLSSGLLLYGASMIYGFTGSVGFEQIAIYLDVNNGESSIGVIIGMVLMICALAFKISAVPFHMWVPDVYEGAPAPVAAFFAIAPKLAAVALFTRLLMMPFGGMIDMWQQVIIALSVASMAVGSIAAIKQTNIKRLLAYSSIGHMGYALVGLAAGTKIGIQSLITYITIYAVMSAGAFCIVLLMTKKDIMVEKIKDLAGLGVQQPKLGLAMAVIMFSMAGLPPLAGFFGKFFIFQAAINAELYALAVLGVIMSVISAYYYLRIIKIMYFVGSEEGIDEAQDMWLKFILNFCAIATVVFVLFPMPLLNATEVAVQALMK